MAAKKPLTRVKNKPLGFGHGLLVIVTSAFVAVLVVGSLWVVGSAMLDRINTSHGTNQIIDIVELSRRVASSERAFGTMEHEDLLLRLGRIKQITVAGESQGLKTVINPWGSNIVAYSLQNNMFRLETNVPSHNCQRIVELLTKNISSLGLRQIETKENNAAWQLIYSAESGHDMISPQTIIAGCHNNGKIDLALTFVLR